MRAALVGLALSFAPLSLAPWGSVEAVECAAVPVRRGAARLALRCSRASSVPPCRGRADRNPRPAPGCRELGSRRAVRARAVSVSARRAGRQAALVKQPFSQNETETHPEEKEVLFVWGGRRWTPLLQVCAHI